MSLMFDSIIFYLNPYFGYSTTFVYFSLHLCKFAMLLYMYILLSPQEEEVHSSSYGNRRIHLAAHSSKIVNHLSVIILVCRGNT